MTATRKMLTRPRKSVKWFAGVMEERLQRNDQKGGWETCSDRYLLERLAGELIELAQAVSTDKDLHVIYEAADLANFAMMIADNRTQKD